MVVAWQCCKVLGSGIVEGVVENWAEKCDVRVSSEVVGLLDRALRSRREPERACIGKLATETLLKVEVYDESRFPSRYTRARLFWVVQRPENRQRSAHCIGRELRS